MKIFIYIFTIIVFKGENFIRKRYEFIKLQLYPVNQHLHLFVSIIVSGIIIRYDHYNIPKLIKKKCKNGHIDILVLIIELLRFLRGT